MTVEQNPPYTLEGADRTKWARGLFKETVNTHGDGLAAMVGMVEFAYTLGAMHAIKDELWHQRNRSKQISEYWKARGVDV